MPCSSCGQRRVILAAAVRRAKAGDLPGAAQRVAEAAVHLVQHPPKSLRIRGARGPRKG